MNRIAIIACFLSLASIAPASAQAQRTPAPSIAVGEPDPNASRVPGRPAAQAQTDAMFKAWDHDGNGVLSIGEFRAGSVNLRRAGEVQGRLHHQFTVIDANKSGALEPAEYANLELIKRAGKAALPLSNFDANKNGKLELGEYLKLVRMLAPQETGKGKP